MKPISAARAAIPVIAGLLISQSALAADVAYVVKPVAEMKIKQLPKGALYWRVKKFPTLDRARAARSAYRWNPDTVSYDGWPSLAAEVAGGAWLFTLGLKGATTPGGTKVAEIGPVPPISASEYLLRVNYGSGAPGAKTPVHSHFGSEAFYVVAGKLGQKTPRGVNYVKAGHVMNGHMARTPMQVFNAGTADLTTLIMFVVDATKPFSTPAKFDEGGG